MWIQSGIFHFIRSKRGFNNSINDRHHLISHKCVHLFIFKILPFNFAYHSSFFTVCVLVSPFFHFAIFFAFNKIFVKWEWLPTNTTKECDSDDKKKVCYEETRTTINEKKNCKQNIKERKKAGKCTHKWSDCAERYYAFLLTETK